MLRGANVIDILRSIGVNKEAIMSVYGKLALFGIILHLILFYSIFDIYYSSPLIRGTRLHPITLANGLATRLVIFSAGLSLFF